MNKLKAWTPIIVALLAMIGCIWSAYYQGGRSDDNAAAVRALVEQINHEVIPRIHDAVMDIRERLAVIESGCCRSTVESAQGPRTASSSNTSIVANKTAKRLQKSSMACALDALKRWLQSLE